MLLQQQLLFGSDSQHNEAPQLLSNLEVLHHLQAQKQRLDPLIAAQDSQIKRRRFDGDLKLWNSQTQREKNKERPTFMYPKELDPELGKLSEEEERREKRDEVRGAMVSGPVVMVQDAVLKYLSLPELPTSRQSTKGLEHVMGELANGAVELTKAELYMISNLCPASGPAFYCIVEEVEARCTDEQMEEIIHIIQDSLSAPDQIESLEPGVGGGQAAVGMGMDEEEMQMQQMEEEFVYEAEWGADKEIGVEDDKDGDMD